MENRGKARRERVRKKRTSYNFAQNANLNSFQLLLLLFYLHFGANTRRLLPRPQNKRQAGTYVSSRFLLGIPNRHFSAPEKLYFPPSVSFPVCCCFFRMLPAPGVPFIRFCIGERFLNISWSSLVFRRWPHSHKVQGEVFNLQPNEFLSIRNNNCNT